MGDQPSTFYVKRDAVVVRKALIGWWVNGAWCPTAAIRDHAIKKRGGQLR